MSQWNCGCDNAPTEPRTFKIIPEVEYHKFVLSSQAQTDSFNCITNDISTAVESGNLNTEGFGNVNPNHSNSRKVSGVFPNNESAQSDGKDIQLVYIKSLTIESSKSLTGTDDGSGIKDILQSSSKVKLMNKFKIKTLKQPSKLLPKSKKKISRRRKNDKYKTPTSTESTSKQTGSNFAQLIIRMKSSNVSHDALENLYDRSQLNQTTSVQLATNMEVKCIFPPKFQEGQVPSISNMCTIPLLFRKIKKILSNTTAGINIKMKNCTEFDTQINSLKIITTDNQEEHLDFQSEFTSHPFVSKNERIVSSDFTERNAVRKEVRRGEYTTELSNYICTNNECSKQFDEFPSRETCKIRNQFETDSQQSAFQHSACLVKKTDGSLDMFDVTLEKQLITLHSRTYRSLLKISSIESTNVNSTGFMHSTRSSVKTPSKGELPNELGQNFAGICSPLVGFANERPMGENKFCHYNEAIDNILSAIRQLNGKCRTKNLIIQILMMALQLYSKTRISEKFINKILSIKSDSYLTVSSICSVLLDQVKYLDNAVQTIGVSTPSLSNDSPLLESREAITTVTTQELTEIASGMAINDVKAFGKDSLLLKWRLPSNTDNIVGYELLINDVLKRKVLSGTRTCAVISNVDFSNTLYITLFAVNANGRCLPPVQAVYII